MAGHSVVIELKPAQELKRSASSSTDLKNFGKNSGGKFTSFFLQILLDLDNILVEFVLKLVTLSAGVEPRKLRDLVTISFLSHIGGAWITLLAQG